MFTLSYEKIIQVKVKVKALILFRRVSLFSLIREHARERKKGSKIQCTPIDNDPTNLFVTILQLFSCYSRDFFISLPGKELAGLSFFCMRAPNFAGR